MAYVGAPPANRVLTSADIAQGSVTLDDINFTDQPTNLDITGTIDKHTMRLADGVTVTGDVTISDDLVLSKLSDDGNAITLTNDSSTRTITGSGSIEASTLAQSPNASLTGMTGTIGSPVVFPAGHIIQMKYSVKTDTATTDVIETGTAVSTGLTVTLDNALQSSSNKVLIMVNLGCIGQQHGGSGVMFRIDGGTTDSFGDAGGSCQQMTVAVCPRGSDSYWMIPASMTFEDTPGTTVPKTYVLKWKGSEGTCYLNRPYSQNSNGANTISTITAMEIQV